jgi:hypothetical protein
MGAANLRFCAVRAHMAIILILTLTIDAFDPEEIVGGALKVAGDYSAVFPLLTVAVFVALQVSRQTVFYEKQRSRGDIMALPEVLCEPGKEGRPLVMDYDGHLHELDESDYEYETDSESDSEELSADGEMTQRDIEANFEAKSNTITGQASPDLVTNPTQGLARTSLRRLSNTSSEGSSRAPSPLPPRPQDAKPRKSPVVVENKKPKINLRGLDDLLNGPIEEKISTSEKKHRRTRSEPGVGVVLTDQRGKTMLNRKLETSAPAALQRKGGVTLKRVHSFGQVDQEQPSLIDQARRRAASFATAERTQKRKQKSEAQTTYAPGRPARKNSYES